MTFHTNFKSDLPTRVDRKLEKDAKAAAAWKAVCKVVDFRDKRTCRACGKKTNPDDIGLLRGHRHHIIYRSAGGADVSCNLVTLCATDHNAEHKGQLRIDGDPDVAMTFWKKDAQGTWYLWRREIAVGRFEKD